MTNVAMDVRSMKYAAKQKERQSLSIRYEGDVEEEEEADAKLLTLRLNVSKMGTYFHRDWLLR